MAYFIELTEDEYINLDIVRDIQFYTEADEITEALVQFISTDTDNGNPHKKRYYNEDAVILKNAMKFFNTRR